MLAGRAVPKLQGSVVAIRASGAKLRPHAQNKTPQLGPGPGPAGTHNVSTVAVSPASVLNMTSEMALTSTTLLLQEERLFFLKKTQTSLKPERAGVFEVEKWLILELFCAQQSSSC